MYKLLLSVMLDSCLGASLISECWDNQWELQRWDWTSHRDASWSETTFPEHAEIPHLCHPHPGSRVTLERHTESSLSFTLPFPPSQRTLWVNTVHGTLLLLPG